MVKFKTDFAKNGFDKIHPKLQEIAKSMSSWCFEYDKNPMVITETLTNKVIDKMLGRVSSSHREGRAFDIRTADWSEEKLKLFLEQFEEQLRPLGAVSRLDGIRRCLVIRPHGSGAHIHVQLGKDIISKKEN